MAKVHLARAVRGWSWSPTQAVTEHYIRWSRSRPSARTSVPHLQVVDQLDGTVLVDEDVLGVAVALGDQEVVDRGMDHARLVQLVLRGSETSRAGRRAGGWASSLQANLQS